MGSPWRNRAYCAQMGAMLLAGAALTLFCFSRDTAAGVACACVLAVLTAVPGWFTRRRYRQIAALSEQLAKIASGDYRVDITAYGEGELSILSSEIVKITTALAHQAADLDRDKTFLADTLADISHQLKTPLTALSVLADLLESPDLPEERRLEFLRGVRASLDRIQWLVSALLKLSRLDAGAVVMQPREVPLRAVVEDAVAPLQITAEQSGRALHVAPDAHIRLETDRPWLAEAVGNLVKNCLEHTGAGGEVQVCCLQNPIYTQIQVWDDGPGISPGDLPHIFERFYRGGNASPDSVGIGLALSKSIVRNLGGTITAENRPEGGARFTIRLYRQPGG